MKFIILLLLLIGVHAVQASENLTTSSKGSNPVAPPKEESIYDKIWGLPKLYKDNNNHVLEEFNIIGRFQFDYFDLDSTKKNVYFNEIRRARIGIDTWWFDRHVQFKTEMDTSLRSYGGREVTYNRMTNLFLNFHVNDAINFRVGKFEPHFGYDREFSDNEQKFFERTFFDDNVFNKTGNDYLSGTSLLGKVGNWGYQVAVFSNNVDKEFGNFHGGYSSLYEISYDFAKDMHVDKALWALDYMHMSGFNATNSNVFNTMNNAAETYFDYKNGRFSFVTELCYGQKTGGKGNMYEIMFMPAYMLTDKLELVTRYQFGYGTKPTTIVDLNRQESKGGAASGDNLNSLYVGLNYYIYGQKLKLMVGEQVTKLTGGSGASATSYSACTTLVGLRMWF